MKEERKNSIESFIDHEKTVNQLLKEFNLKPAQCQLIRAFLIASKGRSEFEASNNDLAKIIYKTDGQDYKKLSDRIRTAFIGLEKWQEKNGLTLVRVIEKGHRVNEDKKGLFTYSKTKYEFVLLSEIVKSFSENSGDIEEAIKLTIKQLKERFVPAPKANKYHPREWMRRSKKTIFTKLRRIFQLAVEVGDDPVAYCQEILNDGWEILHGLETEYSEYQHREKFIAEFESECDTELSQDIDEFNY